MSSQICVALGVGEMHEGQVATLGNRARAAKNKVADRGVWDRTVGQTTRGGKS